MVCAGLRIGLALVAWLTCEAASREFPSAAMSVDSAAVVLGSPVHLRLTARHGPGSTSLVPPLDSLLAWSAAGPVDVVSLAAGPDTVGETHNVDLRFYELGTQLVPSVKVGFVSTPGDTVWRHTREIQITVNGVREPGDEALRSIRGPLAVASGPPLWLAGMVGVVVLGGVAAAARRLRRRRQRADATLPPPPVNYRAEFSRILAMGLIERGAHKAYYSLLSKTLRQYLEECLEVDALDQTTQEIAAALRSTGLTDPLLANRALDFLRQADQVKFAREVPSSEAARRAAEEGQLLVGDIEADLASRPAANASGAVAPTASGEIAEP